MSDLKQSLIPILRLLIQFIVGAVVFIGIGSVSVLLNYVASWISGAGVSEYIVAALRVLELLLFALDVLCFLLSGKRSLFVIAHLG